jgi:hypothetical protein
MGKNLRISSYIRKPFFIYDFASDPIGISLYMRKPLFSFFISVQYGHDKGSSSKCTVPEIIDPVFAKTSQNARFLLSENERFGLVFVKTGSINSGTVVQQFRKRLIGSIVFLLSFRGCRFQQMRYYIR